MAYRKPGIFEKYRCVKFGQLFSYPPANLLQRRLLTKKHTHGNIGLFCSTLRKADSTAASCSSKSRTIASACNVDQPSSANNPTTVDLPHPIPPVSPIFRIFSMTVRSCRVKKPCFCKEFIEKVDSMLQI